MIYDFNPMTFLIKLKLISFIYTNKKQKHMLIRLGAREFK